MTQTIPTPLPTQPSSGPVDSTAMSPPDVVLRFLSSIGRPAEAEQYLKLFQSSHPERFAILHVSDAVIRDALPAFTINLEFLASLGLRPVLAVGAASSRGANRQAEKIVAAMAPRVSCRITDAAHVAEVIRDGAIAIVPIVSTENTAADDARFDQLAELAIAVGTRKLIFVSRRSGLQPTAGRVISMIDLTTELTPLIATLPAPQRQLLRQIARVIGRVAERSNEPLTVAVTSPLDLLRELFTVKGAGTLIRRSSRIQRHGSWDAVDGTRLTRVIEDAFGRKLATDFHTRPVRSIYVADDFRGAAIITDTALAPYLSKFAVSTVARGEGIGRDLWRALSLDLPRLYWRSRAENPITSWYREQCDGLQRIVIGDTAWVVLWRGLDAAEVPTAIANCRNAPVDFVS